SAVKYGSASRPARANGVAFGSDQRPSAQWLVRMRQPSNFLSLRTNQRSPVKGSMAGWDSHIGLAIPGRSQRATFGAAWAATGAKAIKNIRYLRMQGTPAEIRQ